jgi:hypothetical protein
MSSILQEAKKHLLVVQNRQKLYADTKRKELSFDVGTQILLGTSNIKLTSKDLDVFLVKTVSASIKNKVSVQNWRLIRTSNCKTL